MKTEVLEQYEEQEADDETLKQVREILDSNGKRRSSSFNYRRKNPSRWP